MVALTATASLVIGAVRSATGSAVSWDVVSVAHDGPVIRLMQ
jgi:hypothetical protein